MPERCADLLAHPDAVACIVRGATPIDRPARQEILFHLEVELEAAAGEDDRFAGLEIATIAGPDASHVSLGTQDEFFRCSLVHDFDPEGVHKRAERIIEPARAALAGVVRLLS